MKLIVAVNKKGFIGKEGKMLWKCSDDLKHFKNLTMDSKCLVGRVTYEGLPPLKGRKLIVVGKGHYSFPAVVRKINKKEIDWVIGGSQIYQSFIYNCDEIHISYIDNEDEGDVKFKIPEDYNGKIFSYHFKQNI